MIEYIYFVKCPNCDDEPFNFFNDAKDFALGCLSKKPVITQTEVCRNDFGECTDSSDLGTIWSWEDMMKDVPADDPEISVFTKDDLAEYDPDQDPEFSEISNSLDDIPDNFRKPIPADMTIDALVEEMEENEDIVECKWCNELFDKSECRYEVDLGWLCSRCEAAIKSRGETLTFRENNYWDFLDEDISLTEGAYDFEYLAKLADAKLQILEVLKQTLPSHYFKGDKFDDISAVYSKYGYTASVKDFNISPSTGRIDITYQNNRDKKIYIGDLEDVLENLGRNCPANKLFKEIKKAATALNKNNKPSITARRDANVFGILTDNPEVAEEFKNHIKKIEYRIPLLDDYTPDEDKNNEPLTDEAITKLEKIYNDFFSLSFAEDARNAGMVKNRPASEDTNHNIEKSWAAVGNIIFDCPIKQLSEKAQNIITIAKVKKEDLTVASTDSYSTSCYRLANALIRYFNDDVLFYQKGAGDSSLNEAFDPKDYVDLFYDNFTTTVAGPKRDADDWDEVEYSDSYTYGVSKEDVATAIWENFITEEDVPDVPGGLEALEDDAAWNRFLETHFDILFEKYYGQLLKYYEDNAMESFESSVSWDDINESKTKSMLEELEEPGAYRERLTLCPECGSESFDVETSLCISCGFNTLEEDMSNKYYQATKNSTKIEVCRYNDYIPGKYCALTVNAYDQEITYYVSCDEVVDALTELVDDAYIQFQTDETDKLRTVEALRNADKLREFFMDDLSTHIHNYYREINDYFIDEWEDKLELEFEDDFYF